MGTLDVIIQLYEEEMDKLFRASDNYLMSIPRKGCERELELHKERAEVLSNLINDLGGIWDAEIHRYTAKPCKR